MKDPATMTVDELNEHSSYDPTDDNSLLRISKSSYMTYSKCPRQYHWSKVVLKDLRMPSTHEMERGKRIHTALETLYDNWDGQSILTPLIPTEQQERGVEEMVNLEEQRLKAWGITKFKPVEYEEKRVVWDEKNKVVLVGMIDAVLEHPDGGLCIYELKTGNMAKGKLDRTRRELCYYAYILRLMGEERPITHFAYLAPDADNIRLIEEIMNNPKKEVFLGERNGILIVEKINKRSLSAFEKSFESAVNGLKGHDWPMKWNDYFCTQWCEFSMECEKELCGF